MAIHFDSLGRYACGMVAALTMAALLACSQGESNVVAGNRDGVLHFGNGTEPQTIDPHVMSGMPEVNIARALYEGLVVRNPHTLEMEPGTAERWEVSEDGKIMTFHINPMARWSNGDPVTAEDFAWSLQRSLHPELGNQVAYTLFPIAGAQAYATGATADPESLGISVLDRLTLRITLENPDPYFLETLGTYPRFPGTSRDSRGPRQVYRPLYPLDQGREFCRQRTVYADRMAIEPSTCCQQEQNLLECRQGCAERRCFSPN